MQEWVSGVGYKMQAILLSGFRAPDTHAVEVKKCVRWLRAKCQAGDEQAGLTTKLIDAAMDELKYCSVHYVHHLADAFAVLGYHHPDAGTRAWALKLHGAVAVKLFHFHPESRSEFLHRHREEQVCSHKKN